jgi:hypothetical protein
MALISDGGTLGSYSGEHSLPSHILQLISRTGANRYRFWLCAITSIWGQLSGNGLITYFLPVLLRQAGIVNEDRQRVLNLVNSVTSFIGALTGTALVDHLCFSSPPSVAPPEWLS